MVKHVALQHAVMSADVSELQVAAAHWPLALAELYTFPVAPADPVLQKLSGADGGDGAAGRARLLDLGRERARLEARERRL